MSACKQQKTMLQDKCCDTWPFGEIVPYTCSRRPLRMGACIQCKTKLQDAQIPTVIVGRTLYAYTLIR